MLHRKLCRLPRWLSGKESACQTGEDPLEKEMATHSCLLVWEIPWTEDPGGYSPWGHRKVRHNFATKQQIIMYACLYAREHTYEGVSDVCTITYIKPGKENC